MTRADLQQLVRDRIREAKALLAARCWSGAYYLAGYIVECALKSCIINHLMLTDEFPEKRFSEQCWTHNLVQLLALAGLKPALERAFVGNPVLAAYWDVVKDWNEGTRYRHMPRTKAQYLIRAITDKKQGVLQWIKGHW